MSEEEKMTKYEKTKDPNIIRQTESVQSEIHLDKLERQITVLESNIATIAPIKMGEYPDDVIYLINAHNATLPDRTVLEAELKEKKGILAIIKEL